MLCLLNNFTHIVGPCHSFIVFLILKVYVILFFYFFCLLDLVSLFLLELASECWFYPSWKYEWFQFISFFFDAVLLKPTDSSLDVVEHKFATILSLLLIRCCHSVAYFLANYVVFRCTTNSFNIFYYMKAKWLVFFSSKISNLIILNPL